MAATHSDLIGKGRLVSDTSADSIMTENRTAFVTHFTKNVFAAGLCSAVLSASTFAQTCTPPPGFVDTPHPAIVPVTQLVSHIEEITIARPLAVVLEAVDKPL